MLNLLRSTLKKLTGMAGLITCAILIGCNAPGPVAESTPADIKVSWQLVSNFAEPGNTIEAKFIFRNDGDVALGDTAWAMFFNISPRTPLANKTEQPATVSHINGDWYKLTPNKGFLLKPGGTLEVNYRAEDFVIKETDAPLGMYIVYYEADGKEKKIVELGDATVIPFTTKEQMLRGPNDKEPIQTPELDYRKNLSLKEIPADKTLPLVPEPVKYTRGSDSFSLTTASVITAGPGLENEASILAAKLKDLTGAEFKILPGAAGTGNINLKKAGVTVNGISKEAYRLSINKTGINITGSDAAGVFYGIQSLVALIPIEAIQKKNTVIPIGSITIEDAPRFAFRSVHLDVGRNFQTKETILRTLDLMAAYKLNHLLFYTTEDEGWRIEIDGLPELTEVGAERQHQQGKEGAGLHPAYGSGPVAKESGKHGSGFYSKADFIEILKYASNRHIKIIPELNFPGHARAAIKAMEARYERLMKNGKEAEANEYRLVDPLDKSTYISAQGYQDNVVDVTRPSTYHFYEKVVDELINMYKAAGLALDIMHIGGDEVASGAWEKSPPAIELFKKNPGMGTYKNFHPYFVRNLLPLLQKRNLAVHAWEEAALLYKADGSTLPNPEFAGGKLVPYIWNNLYDPGLGYRLANAGYPIVLCSVTNFYFDLAYDNSPVEPGLYWAGFVDTRDAFTFDPYNIYNTTYTNSMGVPMVFNKPEMLKPAARKNIIGLEAQIWSETIKGQDMLEYYLLPKLFGYAQSAWSAARPWENVSDIAAREKIILEKWNSFANTIATKDMPRLSYLNGGYNYRVPPPGGIIENGELKANVSLPGLVIRYTTDGTDPVAASALYTAPVKLNGKVKLRCFDAAGKASRVVSL
ncbi:family 20 glycosylhydrolase [Flavihumibacter fluvii]|uniref:family 20 glycosylhydrolase n=1 Tax=Flavihumibacter fluvii TaxID=2838157 RepID=UPI001BDF1DC8|nr:family 20 glycosylhydrolase [Flavihumibacter fluvii]ULQ50863.1 carbohydate-binding domain-containing protein [Flavihumibacter fluvii]